MNHVTHGLSLKQQHMAQMEADAVDKAPEEACGIIIGSGDHSEMVVPVTNALHSPTRFLMEPGEELEAFYLAEKKKLDVLAVYHSHPYGPGHPSMTDLEELSFPGIIYLIWYKEFDGWHCRGFYMASTEDALEVSLSIY